MVEFAVAFPLFLFLFMALFDGARMLASYISLTNAARELTRNLAIPCSSDADPARSACDKATADAYNERILYFGAPDSTDSVTIRITAPAGSRVSAPAQITCTPGVPISYTYASSIFSLSNCGTYHFPSRSLMDGGTVQVTLSASFQFTPFYQALLQNLQHVTSGSAPVFVITTSAESFIE